LAAATIVAVLVYNRWGSAAVIPAFLVELVLIFVLAEAVPKTYALLATDQTALRIAPLARAISLIAPLRWAARLLIGVANVIIPGKGRATGPTVTEDDLVGLASIAVHDDVLEIEERKLIENTIEFGDTVVREVMVPRPDMVTVASDFRVGDVIEMVILNGFSRLPVSGDGIDDVIGVVHAKDLMRAERDGKADASVTEVLRPAVFVPETKKVPSLLRDMQEQRYHLAIVVDEYGGTAGLVTLEDLIEELVGEIVDEYDVEDPQVERLPRGELRVNARMNIDDLNDLLDDALPEGDWDSVGGLLIALLGHVPTEGESAIVDGHQLRAERVSGRRIGRVVITPTS
jgi:CBS domain containing-hemolysin-like protein